MFEHTDGLNYVHTEFSRVDDISKIFETCFIMFFLTKVAIDISENESYINCLIMRDKKDTPLNWKNLNNSFIEIINRHTKAGLSSIKTICP